MSVQQNDIAFNHSPVDKMLYRKFIQSELDDIREK